MPGVLLRSLLTLGVNGSCWFAEALVSETSHEILTPISSRVLEPQNHQGPSKRPWPQILVDLLSTGKTGSKDELSSLLRIGSDKWILLGDMP
jgi:hypothetical protein